MATLFFAREGLDLDRATSVLEIPLSDFLVHFDGLASKFFSGPPQINPDSTPSPYSAYTLVVLEVESDETGPGHPNQASTIFQAYAQPIAQMRLELKCRIS
jgi:hypothetical protein